MKSKIDPRILASAAVCILTAVGVSSDVIYRRDRRRATAVIL